MGAFSAAGGAFGPRAETEIVRNEPYQAEAVTEIKQTLADGTHIFQSIAATVARDRDGRTFRSQKLGQDRAFFPVFRIPGGPASSSARNVRPTLTVIFDPVARKHIDYLSDLKIAHVMPVEISPAGRSIRQGRAFPGPPRAEGGAIAAPPPPDEGGGPGGGPPAAIFGFPPGAGAPRSEKTIALGTRTIEGLKTVGTRRTWTIPKGAIGNDRALLITEETWYSPKLKLVVRSVHNDPRFGQTSYTLRSIKLIEPSSRLFRIPPGYRVDEIPAPPLPGRPPGSPSGPPPDGGRR
jgi:hypothetical protein